MGKKSPVRVIIYAVLLPLLLRLYMHVIGTRFASIIVLNANKMTIKFSEPRAKKSDFCNKIFDVVCKTDKPNANYPTNSFVMYVFVFKNKTWIATVYARNGHIEVIEKNNTRSGGRWFSSITVTP